MKINNLPFVINDDHPCHNPQRRRRTSVEESQHDNNHSSKRQKMNPSESITAYHGTSIHHQFQDVNIEPSPIDYRYMTVVDRIDLRDSFATTAAAAKLSSICMDELKKILSPLLSGNDGDAPRMPSSSNKQQPCQKYTVGCIHSSQASLWEARYNELVEHRNVHGHCLVDPAANKILGNWIKRQRTQYKQKIEGGHTTLTDERQSKLCALGFVWQAHDLTWEYRFNDLMEFKTKTGHTNVPSIYKGNPPLGIWVKGQRRRYRIHSKGQKSSLTSKRIERLNAINFQWSYRRQSKVNAKSKTDDVGNHCSYATAASSVTGSSSTDSSSVFESDFDESTWEYCFSLHPTSTV